MVMYANKFETKEKLLLTTVTIKFLYWQWIYFFLFILGAAENLENTMTAYQQ